MVTLAAASLLACSGSQQPRHETKGLFGLVSSWLLHRSATVQAAAYSPQLPPQWVFVLGGGGTP